MQLFKKSYLEINSQTKTDTNNNINNTVRNLFINAKQTVLSSY